MIQIDDQSIIEWSMKSLNTEGCRLIFIVRQEHIDEFSIDAFLKEKFGQDTVVLTVPELTRGSVETCLAAKKLIHNDDPLAIWCSDVYFEPQLVVQDFAPESDGDLLTFKSNSPNYSYCALQNDKVTNVVEKRVISPHANVGLYWFRRGKDFVEAADQMIAQNITTNAEFFIAPLYNLLIQNGRRITHTPVEKVHIFGSDTEYDFFVNKVLPTIKKTKVALCSDHSGFVAKEEVKSILDEMEFPYVDFGTFSDKDCDYSNFISSAAKSVLEKRCSFGMAFCRSGQGVNIAANKINGIRSAWVNNAWLAEMAIRHNAANFLAISQEFNTFDSLREIIEAYLKSTFDGGRHQARLMASKA